MDKRKLHICFVNTTIHKSESTIQIGQEIIDTHGWITKTLLVISFSPFNTTGQQYNLDNRFPESYGLVYNRVWSGVTAGSLEP